jgi:hypothetical protein
VSRDFNPVSAALWSSGRFLGLDSDARVLMLYCMTGPHQNSSGCCRIREGYALADLLWEAARYRTALSALVAAELVMFDPKTEEIYVHRWFHHKGNVPTNRDHGKGTMKIIANIDSDEIREQVEADFQATSWGQKAAETVAVPGNSNLAKTSYMNGRRAGI